MASERIGVEVFNSEEQPCSSRKSIPEEDMLEVHGSMSLMEETPPPSPSTLDSGCPSSLEEGDNEIEEIHQDNPSEDDTSSSSSDEDTIILNDGSSRSEPDRSEDSQHFEEIIYTEEEIVCTRTRRELTYRRVDFSARRQRRPDSNGDGSGRFPTK